MDQDQSSLEGWGRVIYVNGELYEGQFKNNKRDGYGRFIYNDGSYY